MSQKKMNNIQPQSVRDVTMKYDTEGIKPIIHYFQTYVSSDTGYKEAVEITNILYFKNEDLPELGKTEYTLTKGDKFYIYPDCTIPRYKLRALCEKEGCSIVRDSNKANIRIIGNKSLESGFKRRSMDAIRIGFVLNNFGSSEFALVSQFAKDAIEKGDVTEDDYILLEFQQSRKFEDRIYFGLDKDGDEIDSFESNTIYLIKDEDDCNMYENLLSDKDLYHEKALLKLINSSHGTVMTEEMYQTIINLFEADDNSNLVVAMESMSNCQYPDSAKYLLSLLDDYWSKIYHVPTKNNINFRSMLKYFGLTPSSRFSGINDILDALMHAKLFTSDNLTYFYERILEDFSNSTSDYFMVDGIKLTPEGEELLKECEPQQIIDGTNS